MRDILNEARSAADDAIAAAERAVRDVKHYLASPQGRRMRANAARALVTVSPAIAATPLLRRSWLVRVLGAAGAATVLVKVAEAIRDWEPERPAG